MNAYQFFYSGSGHLLRHIKKPSFLLILFALSTSFLFAQNPPSGSGLTTIKGKVTIGDTSLPGVSVAVKGSSTTVLTDEAGRYTIRAPFNATLIFSSVGYTMQEIKVGNRATVDVQLTTNSTQLNDVVVVGYGTQRKATVSGSVSSINSDALIVTPATTTSGALVGKVQGITARAADSRPGSQVSIQIRNMGAPLFVIDGVPADAGQFNQLGIADVENISILKDAAAAIYGLQAANGVVLVTTKKGRPGKPLINLSGYKGFQNFTRSPTPPNAYEYLSALATSNQNLRIPNPASLNPTELDKWAKGTDSGYQSYDYYREIFRPNVPQSFITASASGGSPNSKYYLSVSNTSQDALIKDFTFGRTNLQANLEAGLAKGLKVGAQISGRIEKRFQTGVPGTDDYFNPFLTVFSMWPTERPYANDNPNYINGAVHNINVNPATYPKEVTGYSKDDWRAMKTIFTAEYALPFGLTAKGTYQYNYTTNTVEEFEYRYTVYNYNAATGAYNPAVGNDNPWRRRIRRLIDNNFGSLQLNYNKRFGEHTVSATAAYERQENKEEFTDVGALPQNNTVNIIYFADQNRYGNTFTEVARAGYVGRLNYNYKQKYLIDALGRYDGSYLYAKGNRFGLFPGISLGWRLTEENFVKSAIGTKVNELKLRVSYGETGAEIGFANGNAPTPFGYLQGYNYAQRNAVFNGVLTTGVAPTGLPNTKLSWVTNKTKNVGIDLGFFNNRLTASFDVFERKRTGLPGANTTVLLPIEVGYTLPNENLNASDAIRGVEGIISYNGQSQSGFRYSLSLNGTLARSWSISTFSPKFANSWDKYRNSAQNRWSNVNFGYNVIGRFQSQAEIDDYGINNDGQGNRTQLPGDLKYDDVNGDKIINGLDQRPIGYAEGAQPYMSFGFNSNFGYKGFSLQVDFAGATMQTFSRAVELQIPFQNNGAGVGYLLTDAWRRTDPFNPNSAWIPGTYPAVRKDLSTHVNYSLANNFWKINVGYVRLRNLELGYDLPKSLLDKASIKGLRVYVHGTNMLTLDNTKDIQTDPEISSNGGLVYPQQRIYTFGFNLNL